MVDEVQHVAAVAALPEPLDAADALFEAGRVPGEVNVDQRAQGLEVEPLAGRVRGHDEPYRAFPDSLLDLLAFDALPFPSKEDPGLACSGIDGDRLVREPPGQAFGNPARRVEIRAEDDATQAQPVAQEMQHGIELRVGRMRRQHVDDGLEVPAFLVDELQSLGILRRLKRGLRAASRPWPSRWRSSNTAFAA